jgi:hypothetical protein
MVSSNRDDWDRHWDEYSQATQENPAQEYRRKVIFSLLGVRGAGAGVRMPDVGSGQGDMAAAIRAAFPMAEEPVTKLCRPSSVCVIAGAVRV